MGNLFSLRQLEELSGGMSEFVDSMIETFLEHTPTQLNDLVKAFKEGRWVDMGNLAHKIKPSIDLFEIPGIQQTIRDVEKIGKSGAPTPDLESKVMEVQNVLNEVFKQLRNR
ncbi:MAG: Hpt domain-containing protein [Thermaurantimonas sp.]|uniref:HPt domain-containing protein n=1 Tax=Thermaurantimonas aggregans TaxID=2173829 RepID=A0A401XMI1_9FLAO|nr:Hpt domain-containing protein [Thermaurantimonas aggregans]MCX8148408.1 Hpt domain-containing protein [Thermaurantimonas aggregans]GCD78211.1 hypothetical protein JCM31826_16930 [Thermaurantimonas aggregans]